LQGCYSLARDFVTWQIQKSGALMKVLILLLALLCLLVFVVWDRHRIGRSDDGSDIRKKFQDGLNPLQSAKWQATGALALMAFIVAGTQWFDPSNPPFSGRWAALKTVIFGALGTYGLAYLYAGVALAFALYAWSDWKRIHASKK
jgi:hypothetical protein